jgi:cob(I)alamin adenosyltransferase
LSEVGFIFAGRYINKMGYKIYTKTGDDGTTGLVGGNRVKKSDLRLESYGTVDELNSWIGMIRAVVEDQDISGLLKDVQNTLFIIGSKLASDEAGIRITEKLILDHSKIEKLELAIDKYVTQLPPITSFILPGGSVPASYCHIARTVCRRAERCIVRLNEKTDLDRDIIVFINRLSDFLFVLARKITFDAGLTELFWVK